MLNATRFENSGGTLQRAEMLLFWSDDLGKTWSVPQGVPVELPPEKYTWNGAGPLIETAPNRWMYPLETWKPEGYEGPPD